MNAAIEKIDHLKTALREISPADLSRMDDNQFAALEKVSAQLAEQVKSQRLRRGQTGD